MTLSVRQKIAAAVIGMMVVAGLSTFAIVTKANPLQFTAPASTAVATTTLTYMTPGTATTTLVYDTYQVNGSNQTFNANTVNANVVQLMTQFTASSTSSKLITNIEYSQDGIDWYADAVPNLSGYATTTLPISLIPVPSYQWVFASSTIGQAAALATNNRDMRSISIKVPTRFVRAIYSCGIGGTNCAVWGQIIVSKEVK